MADKLPSINFAVYEMEELSITHSMNSLSKVHYFTVNCLRILLKKGFTAVLKEGEEKNKFEYLKDIIAMLKNSTQPNVFLKFEFTLGRLSFCTFNVSSVNNLIFINMCNDGLDSYSMCYKENNIIKSNRRIYLGDDFDAQFIEKIVDPMRCSILINAHMSCPSLLGMPDELLQTIGNYLDLKSIYKLSITCKKMSSFCGPKLARLRPPNRRR